MNRNEATGPGALTPDGCSVELYKLLRPRGEAEIVHRAVAPDGEILELGAGAGRVTHGLIAYGRAVTAVDFSSEMLAQICGATTVHADIVGLDLGRRFAGVVLGSCLVNVVESSLRHEFLRTCARHLAVDGSLFVECHTMSALERAQPGIIGTDENGVRLAWLDVSRSDTRLTGTLEYRHGRNVWTQTFSTHVLHPEELAREFRRCGLRVVRSLNENWIEAKPRSA